MAKLVIFMETAKPEKGTRGGRRDGAGRKRTTVKYYGFKATPEVHAILERVSGQKAPFICACILRAGEDVLREMDE